MKKAKFKGVSIADYSSCEEAEDIRKYTCTQKG